MAHHRRHHTVTHRLPAQPSAAAWIFFVFLTFFLARITLSALLHASRIMVFGLFIATGIWLVIGVGVHTVKLARYEQIAHRIAIERTALESLRGRWEQLESRFPTSREILLQVGKRAYQLGDQDMVTTTTAALQRIDPNNADVKLFQESINHP